MSPKPLKLRVKCDCGTKVILNDVSDLTFISGTAYIASMTGKQIIPTFGWVCPFCGEEIQLSDWNNKKVVKSLLPLGYNLNIYSEKCDYIRINKEIGINTPKDSEMAYMMYSHGLPIPLYYKNKFVFSEVSRNEKVKNRD